MSRKCARFTAIALLALALTLTACAGSGKPTPRMPVQPPATALAPCYLPSLPKTKLDQAEAEVKLMEHRAEIRRCEEKRTTLLKAWPR